MSRRLRLWVLTIAFAATMAAAHVPSHLFPGENTIPKPTVSYAAFGEFVTGAEVFVLKLTYAERFGAPVEMLVPRTDALAAHRPAWAVVARGLPMPTEAERAALPRPLPEGMGAIVDLNDAPERTVIYESVMRRFFFTSRPLAVVFAEGDNELWVWAPGQTKGKFGVGLGVEEGGGYMAALNDWSFYAY